MGDFKRTVAHYNDLWMHYYDKGDIKYIPPQARVNHARTVSTASLSQNLKKKMLTQHVTSMVKTTQQGSRQ